MNKNKPLCYNFINFLKTTVTNLSTSFLMFTVGTYVIPNSRFTNIPNMINTVHNVRSCLSFPFIVKTNIPTAHVCRRYVCTHSVVVWAVGGTELIVNVTWYAYSMGIVPPFSFP